MTPILRLTAHGLHSAMKITPRYPLCGLVYSAAWLFDGETLTIRILAKGNAGRTSRLIWEPSGGDV